MSAPLQKATLIQRIRHPAHPYRPHLTQRRMTMDDDNSILPPPKRTPWNKGKLIGAKPPLLARHVWSIRTKLQIERRTRELAMFNLALSKSKSEVFGQSGHCSPRLLAALRATSRHMRCGNCSPTRSPGRQPLAA